MLENLDSTQQWVYDMINHHRKEPNHFFIIFGQHWSNLPFVPREKLLPVYILKRLMVWTTSIEDILLQKYNQWQLYLPPAGGSRAAVLKLAILAIGTMAVGPMGTNP